MSPAALLAEERRRSIRRFGLLVPSSFSSLFFAGTTESWEFPGAVGMAAMLAASCGDPVLGAACRRLVVSSNGDAGLLRFFGGAPVPPLSHRPVREVTTATQRFSASRLQRRAGTQRPRTATSRPCEDCLEFLRHRHLQEGVAEVVRRRVPVPRRRRQRRWISRTRL